MQEVDSTVRVRRVERNNSYSQQDDDVGGREMKSEYCEEAEE